MDIVTVVELVASAAIAILAAVGVATVKIAALKKEAIEALDAVIKVKDEVKAARDETSPGGKKLTDEEMKGVINKIGNAFIEAIDIIETVKANWGKKK